MSLPLTEDALAAAFLATANHLEQPSALYPEETRLKLGQANKQMGETELVYSDTTATFSDALWATRSDLLMLSAEYSPSVATWLGLFANGVPTAELNVVLAFLKLPPLTFPSLLTPLLPLEPSLLLT